MRQREQHELSDEARRELDALDRALAGEPVDAEYDAVAKLARDMRASRPEPAARFADRLDERAAAGFVPADDGEPSAASRLRGWLAGVRPMRALAPAGALATLLVVVSVAVIQSGDGGDLDSSVEPARTTATEAPQPPEDAGREAAPGPAGGAATEALPPDEQLSEPTGPEPDRIAPNAEREVERSATLSLSADGDEFEAAADGVIAVTDRYDGFVLSSEESASGESSRAVFELKVPSRSLPAALADLSELAHVESRSEDALDITAETVTARQRLTDARTEVRGLLRQLESAGSPGQSARIRDRLAIARAEVAAARTDVQRLARRANYADVRVTVSSDGGGDGDWGIEEAIDDIGDALSTAGGVALVSAAIVLPIGIVAALVAFAWRRSVRRGRERALDG